MPSGRRLSFKGIQVSAGGEISDGDFIAIDENVFRTPEDRKDHVTRLTDGVNVTGDPALDGAGRPERHLWSVVDPERIWGFRPTWRVERPGPA